MSITSMATVTREASSIDAELAQLLDEGSESGSVSFDRAVARLVAVDDWDADLGGDEDWGRSWVKSYVGGVKQRVYIS